MKYFVPNGLCLNQTFFLPRVCHESVTSFQTATRPQINPPLRYTCVRKTTPRTPRNPRLLQLRTLVYHDLVEVLGERPHPIKAELSKFVTAGAPDGVTRWGEFGHLAKRCQRYLELTIQLVLIWRPIGELFHCRCSQMVFNSRTLELAEYPMQSQMTKKCSRSLRCQPFHSANGDGSVGRNVRKR